MTVVQRFGSALHFNVHFHVLALDGVYARDREGRLVFHRDRPPTTEDVERLVEQIAEAAERMFAREGFGREEPEQEVEPDDALALIQAASISGRSAIRGRHARRYQVLNGREYRLPPRCASCDGYTVHAGTAVGGRDAEGRERLCRYLARPALARPRLTELPDGRVLLELKTPWSDGTASLTFGQWRRRTSPHSRAPGCRRARTTRRGRPFCIGCSASRAGGVRSVAGRCGFGRMRGFCPPNGFSRGWSARRAAHQEGWCASLEPRVWGARRCAPVYEA